MLLGSGRAECLAQVCREKHRCRLPGTWTCENRARTLPAMSGGRAGAGHVLEGVCCSFPTKFNSIPAKGEMPIMSSSCHVEGPCSLSGSDSLWCVPAAIKCCCRFLFLFTRGFVVSGYGQSVPAGSQRCCSGSARPGVTACMCGGGPGENTISAAPPPDTSAVLWSFGEHSSLGASPGSSEQWRGHRRERSPCAHSWCVCVSGEHHFVSASLLSPSSSASHTCWLHHTSTL